MREQEEEKKRHAIRISLYFFKTSFFSVRNWGEVNMYGCLLYKLKATYSTLLVPLSAPGQN
jgi:hypothetical protein